MNYTEIRAFQILFFLETKTHWDRNTLLKKLKKDKKNYVMHEPPPRYFYWGQKPTWDKNTLNLNQILKVWFKLKFEYNSNFSSSNSLSREIKIQTSSLNHT